MGLTESKMIFGGGISSLEKPTWTFKKLIATVSQSLVYLQNVCLVISYKSLLAHLLLLRVRHFTFCLALDELK